jgi:hypothetical protein
MRDSKGSGFRLCNALRSFFKPEPEDAPTAASVQTEAFSILYGGRSYLKKNGTAALEVVIQSAKKLTIEYLYLDIGGQRLPALAWQDLTIANSYSGFQLFKLTGVPASAPEKLKQVSLIALAGGLETRSPQFDISALIV